MDIYYGYMKNESLATGRISCIPDRRKEAEMKQITVDATRENLAKVFTFLQEALAECGASKRQIRQIKLCVEEIYINIVSYAYTPGKGKALITFDTVGEIKSPPIRAVITFTDKGCPFDPLSKEDPDLDLGLDETPIGGLGIFIVKETMDSVSYERRNEQNIFTMIKTIDLQAG